MVAFFAYRYSLGSPNCAPFHLLALPHSNAPGLLTSSFLDVYSRDLRPVTVAEFRMQRCDVGTRNRTLLSSFTSSALRTHASAVLYFLSSLSIRLVLPSPPEKLVRKLRVRFRGIGMLCIFSCIQANLERRALLPHTTTLRRSQSNDFSLYRASSNPACVLTRGVGNMCFSRSLSTL